MELGLLENVKWSCQLGFPKSVPPTDYDIQLVEILPSSIRQALLSQAECGTVQRLSKVVWNPPVREVYKLLTLNI